MIADERRQRIDLALVDPDKRHARLLVLTFVKRVHRCTDLTEFFARATEHDIRVVEQHLGLNRHGN